MLSKGKFGAAALFIGALAAATQATAGEPGPEDKAAQSAKNNDCAPGADCLIVLVDHLSPLKLKGRARTMLIGNPAVADVNMLSDRQAVVTARSVGSTNVIFLDRDDQIIGNYEVYVREPAEKRVVLRRGPAITELYQCAPRCERTLTQLDTPEQYSAHQKVVDGDNKLSSAAEQSGAHGDLDTPDADHELPPDAI